MFSVLADDDLNLMTNSDKPWLALSLFIVVPFLIWWWISLVAEEAPGWPRFRSMVWGPPVLPEVVAFVYMSCVLNWHGFAELLGFNYY